MNSLENIEEQSQASEPKTTERQLPIGVGGTELKKDKETLPAVEVANEVSWVSGYLAVHNITLDARLVDLDSVVVFRKDRYEEGAGGIRKSYEDDFYYARRELLDFFRELKTRLSIEPHKYIKSFEDTYKTELEKLKSKKNARKLKR